MISQFHPGEVSAPEDNVPTPVHYQRKGKAKRIAINDIQIADTRRRLGSDQTSNDDLVESIRDIGLLQPILIRESNHLAEQKLTYELISGHRRLKAVQQLDHAEINAVIVSDFTDADIAVAFLRENLDRKNPTDFEIFIRLKALGAQFPERAKIAEELGLCRSIRYRILSFGKLPDFVRDDLHREPELLSGKSAEAVCKVLKQHGEEGVAALRILWQKVVDGALRQGSLAETLEKMLQKNAPREAAPNVRPIMVGDKKAGTSLVRKSALVIKIDRRFLPHDQAEVLLEKIIKHLEFTAPALNQHDLLQGPVATPSPDSDITSAGAASADNSLSPNAAPASSHETREDSKQPEIILLSGIAAAGKSTYCKQYLPSHHVVSLDAIPSNSRKKEEILFKQLIADRKSVVIDNTNLTRDARVRYIKPAIQAGYRIVGIEFKTHVTEALQRNKSRPNKVPDAAIKRQAKQIESLDPAEGFHQILLEPPH